MKTGLNDGVKWMIIASFCFAAMGVFVKILSQSLGILEITFFRNIIGVLVIAATIRRFPLKGVGGKPLLLFFRGFMGFVSLLAYFYNIAHIPLADAMTFSKTSPIFTAIIAFFVFKDRLSGFGWGAIFLGFFGTALVMKPDFNIGLKTTDIMGLVSGFGAALAYTSVKELKKFYDTRTVVLSFMLIGSLGPLLMIILNEFLHLKGFEEFFGKPTFPTGISWVYILFMGIFATLAQIFMTRAYGASKAGIAAAVSYADIVFAGIFSAILWQVYPDMIGLFGIIFVIISGVLVAKEKN